MSLSRHIEPRISALFGSIGAAAVRHPIAFEIVLAPLAIGLVFAIAFGHVMGAGKITITYLDNTHVFLPLFHHISQTFAQGEYPFWVNTIAGGMRIYDTPQFAIEYPFYFFRWNVFGNPADALLAAQNIVRLHIFIAYVNSYILLRVLRVSRVAAFLGASIFVISPNMYFYSHGVTILAPYAWFPLVIASIFLICENIRQRAGVLLGVFSLSLLILASPSQPLIHVVYVIGVIYCVTAVSRWRSGTMRDLVAVTKNLAVMGGLTFILTSPALVPLLLHSGQSIRWVGNVPPIYGLAKIPLEAATINQFRVADFAGILWPLAMPATPDLFFVGISAAAFAVFGLFTARARWIVGPVAFITAYALLCSAGTNLWLGHVNYNLPLMDKIREPERHLILFILGVSILAAFGFDYVVESALGGFRNLATRRHAVVAAIIILAIIGASVVWTLGAYPYVDSVPPAVLIALSILPFAVLLLLPLRAGRRARVALTAFAALSLVFANMQYSWNAPRFQDGDYFTAPNLASHKTLADVAKIPDIGQYRLIVREDSLGSQMWAMNGIYYGVRSFQAFMNPMPSAIQFDQMFQRFTLRHYYPLLGGKYYLCRPCDPLLLRDYKYARALDGMSLYVASDALPRYTILNAVAGSFQGPNDFYAKIDAGFDFARSAYLGAADAQTVSTWLGTNISTLHYVLKEEHSSPNRLEVSVNMAERGIFLLNEYNSGDWTATVNGVFAPVFNVNLNQMGVLVDKGANIVEFRYNPRLYVYLLYLQRIAFGLFALYVLWLARQVLHARSASSSEVS